MSKYSEQIQRIKDKLQLAKKADPSLMVFGAGSHKYQIKPPLSYDIINDFEKQYEVEIPDCYKTFLLEVGNGGISYSNSGAGPYYGIYPFGEGIDELLFKNPEKYLKNPCVLYPKMTDEFWRSLNDPIDNDDHISDEAYEEQVGKIFGGILPVGSQGCTYLHGVVLNGEHKGKVINLDMDRNKPQFTYENNFLDWYERWLNEVISGDLVTHEATWFGFNKGGTESELLDGYILSANVEDQNENLYGLLNKRKMQPVTIIRMDEWIRSNPVEKNKNLVQLLAKLDYEKAKPHIQALAEVDFLAALQAIYWYAKKYCSEWTHLIQQKIISIDDEQTFSFSIHVLVESGIDYGKMIAPFTQHASDGFRRLAYYALGQLKNKKDYLNQFIQGLSDDSNQVVHSTLQALEHLEDNSLLEHYKKVAERFPVETDYILSNLNGRLAGYELNNETIKEWKGK